MKELFLSYIYKLRYDIAFRVTLFIGLGLSLVMSLIYLGISFLIKEPILSGTAILIQSLSPTQNFGLAVPINLITFTVMEFSQGSIRNKIIGGHSKGQVYTSLFLNGLVFTFVLMTGYVLLSYGFASLFSLIPIDGKTIGPISDGYSDVYFLRLIILSICTYIFIVSLTIFFSTLFRSVGPSIPVVILLIIFPYLFATIYTMIPSQNDTLLWVLRIIDPFYGVSAIERTSGNIQTITNETFVSGIISSLTYAALFFTGGILIFKKRDIK